MNFKIIVFFIVGFLQNLSAQSWDACVCGWQNLVDKPLSYCDVIQNGFFYVPPSLGPTNDTVYGTRLTFNDAICTGNEFSFEIKLRNPDSLGGFDAYDIIIDLYGDNTNAGVTLMGMQWAQACCTHIYVDTAELWDQSALVLDLSTWHNIKMTFSGSAVDYSNDGSNFFTMPYSNGICNLLGFSIIFKGSGWIDYIRIYDRSNLLVWSEEFDDCNNMSAGLSCSNFYNVSSNSPVCSGSDIQFSSIGNFSSNATLLWSGPNGFTDTVQNPVISNALQEDAGNYSLLVTDNGCTSLPAIIQVIVGSQDTTEAFNSICSGDSTIVGGAYQFATGIYYDSLQNANGCDSIISTHLIVFPPDDSVINVSIFNGESYFAGGAAQTLSGIYYDTLLTSNGCDSIIVTNLSVESRKPNVPTAFSPNSDGSNDFFRPLGDISKFKRLTVFNRWGEKVFETNNPSIGWDGTYQGEFVDINVFTYVLEYIEDNSTKIEKGNITVIK